MTSVGFDTEGFDTAPVSGFELLKDWAAFMGVGAYLGGTYAYLRLRRKIAPSPSTPILAAAVTLGKLGKLVGAKSGALRSIRHHEAHCYIAHGPLQPTNMEGASRLRVLEDGRPLPSPDAQIPEVLNKGMGRYSHCGWSWHWPGRPHSVVLFSSSDNSNPLTNGRSYTYETV